MYCVKFKVPPYPGSYSEQPLRWVKKSLIIKSVIGSASIADNGENKNG